MMSDKEMDEMEAHFGANYELSKKLSKDDIAIAIVLAFGLISMVLL